MALFRSIRFNVYLFVMILAASALGTFVPQTGQSPEKVQAFLTAHAFWGAVFQRLDFFNLYHSVWFVTLLGLMAFDVAVCKLYNAPPDADLKLPRERVEDTEEKVEAAGGKEYTASFALSGTPEGALDKAWVVLGKRGYAVERRAGDAPHVNAVKHRLQRWGSYTAHIGIVVFLIGALLKALFGFEEMLPILENSSRMMQNRPWEVHVDKFTVDYYPGTTTPRLFASDVRVYDKTGTTSELEEGTLLLQKTIHVNEPADLPGAHGLGLVRIYQASWGATGMFESATLAIGRRALEVPQAAKVRIPGTSIQVQGNVMLPDFTITKDDRADTASLTPANPAVQFTFYKNGVATNPLWLLRDYPDVAFMEDEEGMLHHVPPPPFTLAAVSPRIFSGLQIAYDPGIPVLYFGFALVLGGLCALFYLHRRKVWVWAVPGENPRVVVGGWSSRHGEFGPEFTAIVAELKAVLAPRGAAAGSVLASKSVGGN